MIPDEQMMSRALQDFREARRQAAMSEIISRVKGSKASLLSFDEVNEMLKPGDSVKKGVQEIPLDSIVGSCDRYEDFSRSFLPLKKSDQERWANVKLYVTKTGLANIPPILVYQIGAVYFVSDGNHRVSVARQLKATHIKAHVTELKTKVNLLPQDQPDDLILKSEYADFLRRTQLDLNRPEADLQVTVPGKYWILDAQIDAHRFLVDSERGSQISYQEAALYWYDGVYQSTVQIIRERGVLKEFPHRTETDFYLWMFEYRAMLKQNLAWDITPTELLSNLALQHRPTLLSANPLAKDNSRLQASQPWGKSRARTGQWRQEKMSIPAQSRLFFHTLVAITGRAEDWSALEQAIEIARRERGEVWGFHLVASEGDVAAPAAAALRDEFNRRCQISGVSGVLTIEAGRAVDKIAERASLADLVVAPVLNPPGSGLMSRLSSEFRSLVQQCPRPIVGLTGQPAKFRQALLAYDGSSKSKEALYVAAYIAEQWLTPLAVLAVADNNSSRNSLEAEAKQYLDQHHLQATFVQKNGSAGEIILATAEEAGADLIIMGGYGHSRVKDLVLGSAVDKVLTEAGRPVLVCR